MTANDTKLEPSAAGLFPLPPFAQRSHDLYSMANYGFFIEPLLKELAPSLLCEIGSEFGNNTLFLVDFCRRNKARLVICDPKPAEKPEFADVVEVRRQRSLDFLKSPPSFDVVFVDGDHNYETVRKELQSIANVSLPSSRKPFIFLHDIGWPCGRRDFYFDPAQLKSPHPSTFELGLSPFDSGCVEEGVAARGYYHKALESGGPANGVLTAAEDFIAANQDWRMHTVFVINGLAMLWRPEDLTPQQTKLLGETCAHLDWAAPLFGILELSRFLSQSDANHRQADVRRLNEKIGHMHEEMLHAGKEWQKNQDYIKVLEAKTRALQETIGKQEKEMQLLKE